MPQQANSLQYLVGVATGAGALLVSRLRLVDHILARNV